MKKILLAFLVSGYLLTSLTSCEKEASEIPLVSNRPITDTSKIKPTPGAGIIVSGNYQPLTAGSYWKYKITGSMPDEQTQTLTGKTDIINSKTYYEITTVSKTLGTALGHYNAANGIYKLRSSSYVNGFTLELTYLDINKAVGETWTAPVTDNGLVNGIRARIIGKTIAQNINRTVLDKNYSDVIHTQVDLQYDIGGYESYSLYDVYIAKGIGIIEINSSVLGQKFSESKLTEYNIK